MSEIMQRRRERKRQDKHSDAKLPFSLSLFYLYNIIVSLLITSSSDPQPFGLSFSLSTQSQRLVLSPSSATLASVAQAKGTGLHRACLEAMEVDWDLHAVVRGCTAASSTSSGSVDITTVSTSTITSSCSRADFGTRSFFSSFGCGEQQVANFLSLTSDPFEARVGGGDLQELYKPFFPKSEPLYSSSQSVPISCFTPLNEQLQIKQQQQQLQSEKSRAGSVNNSANSHPSRSKKRKNQLKKTCQVPAEALSSDVWAWRKYGQKPIKGSPYPRGYYRCSSSKGCMARKQVERNKSDPGMFIVTYTAEHNHPAPTHKNSLAGSTRQKTSTSQTVTASDCNNDNNKPSPAKPTCSSPAASMEDEFLPQSTNTVDSREEKDIMDDDEDEFDGFSDMGVSDDFFMGLEELPLPVTGDRFSSHLTPSLARPWLVNNATTAAGGI